MGMGMNHWEGEGMGLKKTFPLISSFNAATPQVVIIIDLVVGCD